MARPVLIHCPHTGMNVQHALADEITLSDGLYERFDCPACGGIHFIDRKTGQLLGQSAK